MEDTFGLALPAPTGNCQGKFHVSARAGSRDDREVLAPFIKAVVQFAEAMKSINGTICEDEMQKHLTMVHDALSSESTIFKDSFSVDQLCNANKALVEAVNAYLAERDAMYMKSVKDIMRNLDSGLKDVPKLTSMQPGDLQSFNRAMSLLGKDFVSASDSAGDVIAAVIKDSEAMHVEPDKILACFNVTCLQA